MLLESLGDRRDYLQNMGIRTVHLYNQAGKNIQFHLKIVIMFFIHEKSPLVFQACSLR